MYLTTETRINLELEAKEKKRSLYRAPLPRKSISCYKSGRPCKVRHYTKEEINAYQYEMATDRG